MDQLNGFAEKRNLHRVISKEGENKNLVVYNIENVKSGATATLHLEDIWRQLKLSRGCVINIVNVEPDEQQVYIVNRNGGYVIFEPDQLVTISQIVRQLWCPREAVLSERIRKPFQDSIDTLRGVICHELLAKCMVSNATNKLQVKSHLREVLHDSSIVHKAYALRLSQEQLSLLGEELVSPVHKFMTTRFSRKGTNQSWEITKVRDIEDNYWNPQFGLKGKLDATIDIKRADGTVATIPMEVKTGNAKFEGQKKVRHDNVGQVNLYTLLMNSRYEDVSEGVLYYVREDFWNECNMKLANLQALVLLRNELVQSMDSKVGKLINLPDPSVEFERACLNCSQKDVCAMFVRKKINNVENTENTLTRHPTVSKLLDSITHLSEKETEFFHHWFRFITLEIESSDKSKNAKRLWTVPADKRYYTCLRGLKLVECKSVKNSTGSAHFEAVFEAKDPSTLTNFSLVDVKKNDFLILGTDDEICVSYCFVVSCALPYTITVSLESQLTGKSKTGLFTLDKISFNNPTSINYSYLAQLMEDSPRMKRLREYIILKKQPKFSPITSEMLEESKDLLTKYNSNQQRALMKAISTDSFLFIKGMPGTGKTETIVGLLQLLVRKGKSVLVVGYTSSAVDNIMLKYKLFDNNFIRLGKEENLKAELKPFSISSFTKSVDNVDDLRRKLSQPQVVATTLLSLSHEIFANRTFDYAILDEVSQALPVSCFGSLGLADKYILFGDPQQLPPIIVSGAAKVLGYDETLFASMSTPANTVKLTVQYRMNGIIMNLANKLTYNNQMDCFSEELEKAYLNLPSDALISYIKTVKTKAHQTWLAYVASKKLVRSVVFLDTSEIDAPDWFENNSVKNDTEAWIVAECLKLFVAGGLDLNEVGLIAPYRAQVQNIRRKCEDINKSLKQVEVNTVDQYQGRDKTVIICSFTKTRMVGYNVDENNKDIVEFDAKVSILDDKRRLNVAITRAKRKLIMVGHMEFLKTFETFKDLFGILLPDQVIRLRPEDVPNLEEVSIVKSSPKSKRFKPFCS